MDREFLSAMSIEEAIKLQGEGCAYFAGGTEIEHLNSKVNDSTFILISGIPGLNGVECCGDTVKIGDGDTNIEENDDPPFDPGVLKGKGDSCLLNGRKPFFLPEGVPEIGATECLILRVSRLGKEIAPRFADRYYDAVAPGADFISMDKEHPLTLDNYVLDTPEFKELYESNMPSVRAKYCIDRVRKAINDKNYQYVYEKLNIVQKNNYYKNYNDFENFLKTEFFEKNTFVTGDYIMVSEDIFQYEVNVVDKKSENKEIKKFTMTVSIKDGTNFDISIIKET